MHFVFSTNTFHPPSRSFPINSPASPQSSELTPSSPSLLMKSICCCWQLTHMDKSTSMLSIVLCSPRMKFPGEGLQATWLLSRNLLGILQRSEPRKRGRTRLVKVHSLFGPLYMLVQHSVAVQMALWAWVSSLRQNFIRLTEAKRKKKITTKVAEENSKGQLQRVKAVSKLLSSWKHRRQRTCQCCGDQ